ncbi:hypothetical protein [Anabaena azotica]|uniref:hypothetical protein n=1 Tax=Anabaena azotica TaxID=197653 RepID=UPI0039A50D03
MTILQNKKKQDINPLRENFFAQVSPEIAATFTKEQIEALQKGFPSREWNDHSIDLRISFPVSLISFYLVILAGEERRSKQRLQYEKNLYPLWTPGNIFFIMVFSFIIITGSFSTLVFFKSLVHAKRQAVFPTSIPWIENRNDCERANRDWKDNKCWDSQHSPYF